MQFSTQTINSTYARKQKATSVMILRSPIFIQEFASRHQLFIENSKFILIDPFIHWDKNIFGDFTIYAYIGIIPNNGQAESSLTHLNLLSLNNR